METNHSTQCNSDETGPGTPFPFDEWKEDEWKALLRAIRSDNCILMLGPDTAVEEKDGNTLLLNELLAHQLAEKITPPIQEGLVDTSNLAEVAQYFLLQPKRGRIDLENEIEEFFDKRQSLCNDFHLNLARLPFYFAITSSPDRMFCEALKRQKKEPIIGWYNFNRKRSVMPARGTKENPLVFYLYGTYTEPESVVLTENDLLDFLVSIVAKNTLPDLLLNELQAPDKCFLFLGFGFKQWYLRILLHILEVKKKANPSFALEQFQPRHIDDFKSTVFFFQESPCRIRIFRKDLNRFAQELCERFKKSGGATAETVPTVQAPRPTVFLCHANEDKPYVERLYSKLKDAGIEPWLDKENLRAGDIWYTEIREAIDSVDYFLVLQSKAMEAKNMKEAVVNKEIHHAMERQKGFLKGKFIIPVKIDSQGVLLDELKDLQTIDLTQEDGFDKLVRDIRRDQEIRRKR